MTGMQNVRQIYENRQIWSKRDWLIRKREKANDSIKEREEGGRKGKRCYALDKQEAVGQVEI